MEDQLNESQMYQSSDNKKVPDFLLVLLILTGINVVYNIYKSLKELFVGAQSAEEIQAQVFEQLNSSEGGLSSIPQYVIDAFLEFFVRMNENAVTIRLVDLAYYIALGFAAFLMFKLRMVGYYVYVAVNIVGVLVTPFLYGFNIMTYVLMAIYAIVAVAFIALYNANKKHLN